MRLWAPWRYSYVTGSSATGGCVLCTVGECPEEDAANYVLTRTDHVYVMLNRYPYINGHLMLVPMRHVPDMASLTPDERSDIMEMMVTCERALSQGLRCMGINGGWNLGACAGAGIPGHVHVHMLPRWSGDVNFMDPVSGTRVMSSSLEQSYLQLMPFFRREDRA